MRDVRCRRIFRGVYPRDKLPRWVSTQQPCAFIINTDRSSGPGRHWVALWLDGKGKAEYFDSFGLPPSHLEIKNFILRHCHTYRFNSRLLQDMTSSFCGLYVIFFVYMKSRGASLTRLLASFFAYRAWTNDRVVLRHVRPLLVKRL